MSSLCQTIASISNTLYLFYQFVINSMQNHQERLNQLIAKSSKIINHKILEQYNKPYTTEQAFDVLSNFTMNDINKIIYEFPKYSNGNIVLFSQFICNSSDNNKINILNNIGFIVHAFQKQDVINFFQEKYNVDITI